MGQDVFDLVIILLHTICTVRGYIHGFVHEVAGLVAIVGGFGAAHQYHALLAPQLTFIAEPAWRNIAAYVAIFLLVILVVALVARLLQRFLTFAFVAWADKLAGGILGFVKALLVCSLILLVLQKFFGDADFMQQSRTLPYLKALMTLLRDCLPPDITALGI